MFLHLYQVWFRHQQDPHSFCTCPNLPFFVATRQCKLLASKLHPPYMSKSCEALNLNHICQLSLIQHLLHVILGYLSIFFVFCTLHACVCMCLQVLAFLFLILKSSTVRLPGSQEAERCFEAVSRTGFVESFFYQRRSTRRSTSRAKAKQC